MDNSEIYSDDVTALAGWANAVMIALRQAEKGLPTTDPDSAKDLLETGIRIGIIAPSPVRESA